MNMLQVYLTLHCATSHSCVFGSACSPSANNGFGSAGTCGSSSAQKQSNRLKTLGSSCDIHCVAACRLYQCNVCGEGGEYESLVLDCPLFKHARIVLDSWETVQQSADSFAPVGHLHPVAYHLECKTPTNIGPPKLTPAASSAPKGSPQENLCSNTEMPLTTGGRAIEQSSSKAPDLLAASDTECMQQTPEQDWAAATVIEVPSQISRSTASEAANAEPDCQAVGAVAEHSMHSRQSVLAWSADVQLQSGCHYVRAICCPAQQVEGPSNSAVTADALDCALAAIQQG